MSHVLSSDEIANIVAGAQAAAVDDSLWTDWADNLVRKVGSTGGIFGIVNQQAKVIERPHPIFASIKGFEEYVDGMIGFDPQIPHCLNMRDATIYTDDEHVDRSLPIVADYMKWQEDRFDFCTHITMTTIPKAGFVTALSIHFPRAKADMARGLRAAYQAMLPDVSNAMRLGFSMSDLLTEAYWEGSQVVGDHRAAILLSDLGTVLRLNAAAESVLSLSSELTCRNGHLTSRTARNNALLQRLIHDAILAKDPRGSTIRIDTVAGPGSLIVEAFPVPRKNRVMAIAEPAALLRIHQPDIAVAVQTERLIAAFRLTGAEARVAAELVAGASDEQVARRLGIAISTARSHIKMIYAKTETRNKGQLAHMLTRLIV